MNSLQRQAFGVGARAVAKPFCARVVGPASGPSAVGDGGSLFVSRAYSDAHVISKQEPDKKFEIKFCFRNTLSYLTRTR